ncbi:MAG: alcohol dehydrogenase catalytic domain-containing protein [Clostridiaceae bacterium]|jgi:threonine dehydrogenase-like Zn-dependent dehydrogenase|nr:alcohol dehydrogenase catalytic domain-containing protein [Clostridiaceae bacterium]
MKAVVFDKDKQLKFVTDYAKPVPKKGEALVRVTMAGICNTDYEITKGYMGYVGILGHEVVGIVEEINDEDKSLLGKRVVPEISYGCKDPDCEWCGKKLYRHCPNRHTLGIWQKDGCMAEYFTMPIEVLFEVPENVPTKQAVFVEPLAAACEILEQLHIKPFEKVVILGDGKLGLITALALNAQNIDVLLVGKHQNKLDIAKAQGVQTQLLQEFKVEKIYDVVVEATGTAGGFETAMALTKPRGVLVLKSTVASGKELNLAPIVIDEITVLGSRCGQFPAALRLLKSGKVDFSPMISGIYPADKSLEAFEKNKEKDTLKVLIEFSK